MLIRENYSLIISQQFKNKLYCSTIDILQASVVLLDFYYITVENRI